MSALLQAIGIDLGGTKIEIGRVDVNGQLLESLRFPTNVQRGPEKIQQEMIEGIQKIQASSNVPLTGIGIGVAGQIDSTGGIVYSAPNLPNWHHIPLQATIERALGLPVKIINDVRAITWGEWLFGAGRNAQDLVCVFVGTGIGAGVISQGRILEGFTNTFGEVGHMTIDTHGPLCTCGKYGCWEALAGGWGIAKQAQEAVAENEELGSFLLQLSKQNNTEISAKLVVEAYRQQDPLATSLIKIVQESLIVGCTNLINLYNPRCLVLGGGLIDGMPELVGMIEQGIKEKALKVAALNLEVLSAQLGKQVGVIGAAAVILNKIVKEKLNDKKEDK